MVFNKTGRTRNRGQTVFCDQLVVPPNSQQRFLAAPSQRGHHRTIRQRDALPTVIAQNGRFIRRALQQQLGVELGSMRYTFASTMCQRAHETTLK